jgi:hypothetical protein
MAVFFPAPTFPAPIAPGNIELAELSYQTQRQHPRLTTPLSRSITAFNALSALDMSLSRQMGPPGMSKNRQI